MKRNLKTIIILILIGLIGSCKTTRFGSNKTFYKEEIRDSVLVSSLTSVEGGFVYSECKSIRIKATKEDYNKMLESKVSSISDNSYKEANQEMHRIISKEFEKSDAINLDEIETTEAIKTTGLIFYPIDDLIKAGKLWVYDKKTGQVQDSIWEKNFYREKMSRNSIRERFYQGRLYTTRRGEEIFRIVLKSGR